MDKNKIYPDWQQAGENPPKPEDFNTEGDLIVMHKEEALIFRDATEFIEEIIEKNKWWCKAPDKARFRQSSEDTDYDIATPEEMKVTGTDKEIALPKKKEGVLLEDEIKRLEKEDEEASYTELETGQAKIIKDLLVEIKELRSVLDAGIKTGECEKCESFKEDYQTAIDLRKQEKDEHIRIQTLNSENEWALLTEIETLKKALHVVTK